MGDGGTVEEVFEKRPQDGCSHDDEDDDGDSSLATPGATAQRALTFLVQRSIDLGHGLDSADNRETIRAQFGQDL